MTATFDWNWPKRNIPLTLSADDGEGDVVEDGRVLGVSGEVATPDFVRLAETFPGVHPRFLLVEFAQPLMEFVSVKVAGDDNAVLVKEYVRGNGAYAVSAADVAIPELQFRHVVPG